MHDLGDDRDPDIGPPVVGAKMLKDRVFKELDGRPHGVMAVGLPNGVRKIVSPKRNRDARPRFEPNAQGGLKSRPCGAVQLLPRSPGHLPLRTASPFVARSMPSRLPT